MMLIDMSRAEVQEALMRLYDVTGGESQELAEFITAKSLEFN